MAVVPYRAVCHEGTCMLIAALYWQIVIVWQERYDGRCVLQTITCLDPLLSLETDECHHLTWIVFPGLRVKRGVAAGLSGDRWSWLSTLWISQVLLMSCRFVICASWQQHAHPYCSCHSLPQATADTLQAVRITNKESFGNISICPPLPSWKIAYHYVGHRV